MARVFAVTASTDRLRLDASGRGEVSFTISNTAKRLLRSRVKVQPLGAARADWFSLAGEADRDLAPDATHQVTVRIAAPATATGTFTFQLRVVSIDNPDEDWTDGPATAFEAVGVAKPAGGKFPWWILVVVGALVLIAGGVTAFVLTRPAGLNDACKGDKCAAGLVCGPAGTCLGDAGYEGCKAKGDCVFGVCTDGRCGEETLPATVPVVPPPPDLDQPNKGVIYALTNDNDLLWYDHSGREDGSFRWAAPTGKKIGTAWDFRHVFPGGDGVIYGITASGDLMWYRHLGRGDGSSRWEGPKQVGTGWIVKHVFSGGGGVIYAAMDDGELRWFRHVGREDGTARWEGPKPVGTGWIVRHVFSGGGGVIYAAMDNGELRWYRHVGQEDGSVRWEGPKQVGTGWIVRQVFSGGAGIIYAAMDNGELRWYRHVGREDGSFRWEGPRQVGSGWTFKDIFSGE